MQLRWADPHSVCRCSGYLTLTQPKTTNVTAAALRTQVAGCAPAGIACGTAADPGGVASVEYTLRRQVTAANGP